jgi:NTE family protein
MRPKIGIALGSGSARGWAHIGVINALREEGIEPDIVCGSSIGALVGAAYVCNKINDLQDWVCSLNWVDIVRFMDIKLRRGGFIEGARLMDYFRQYVEDQYIENLPKPFAAVATNLVTGHETWLQKGLLSDAIRASIALPGLFTPVKLEDTWLVDGGLVNPVPVSLCRALGADVVIAVNLNGDILGKHFSPGTKKLLDSKWKLPDMPLLDKLFSSIPYDLKTRANNFITQSFGNSEENPGLFDVLAGAINIMQDRITRSRMAGDPPEVILSPRLARIGLMEFDHAKAAIVEGRECVHRMMPMLRYALSV